MPKVWEFSKKGDFGETTLPSGARVSKSSLILETCGTIEEASCMPGCAKAATGESNDSRDAYRGTATLVLPGKGCGFR